MPVRAQQQRCAPIGRAHGGSSPPSKFELGGAGEITVHTFAGLSGLAVHQGQRSMVHSRASRGASSVCDRSVNLVLCARRVRACISCVCFVCVCVCVFVRAACQPLARLPFHLCAWSRAVVREWAYACVATRFVRAARARPSGFARAFFSGGCVGWHVCDRGVSESEDRGERAREHMM